MSTKTSKGSSGRAQRSGQRSFVLPVVILAALLVAGLTAFIAAGVEADTDSPTAFDTAGAGFFGTPLAPLPSGGLDPEVGAPAPVIEGEDLDGETVTVPAAGRPTVVLFLAHWCPHCQAEVPELTEWLEDGNGPDDVDIVAVATSTDPEQPNYPPSAWLEDEGWPAPVVADATGGAATAYGLTSFPFWAVIDADGNLVSRLSGRLAEDQLEEVIDSARGSASGPAPTGGASSDASSDASGDAPTDGNDSDDGDSAEDEDTAG